MIIFPKISLYKIKKSKIDPKGKIFFSFQQETLNSLLSKLILKISNFYFLKNKNYKLFLLNHFKISIATIDWNMTNHRL